MQGYFVWLAVGALLFATTAWGSLFYVGKAMLSSVDPIWFTVLRYPLATAALLGAGLLRPGAQAPASARA
jgi:drug/metabolite transporter (DMT)-like permease